MSKERQGWHETHSRSKPNQPEQASLGRGTKSPERQPLPNVWDVMERKVRVDSLPLKLRRGEFQREFCETWNLWDEIYEKGTDRDRHIVDLYENAVSMGERGRIEETRRAALSLEEFQQFRSKIEPLSDEEIAEELRQKRKQFSRAFRKFLKTPSPFIIKILNKNNKA